MLMMQHAKRYSKVLSDSKKLRFVGAGILNTGIDFAIFNICIFAFGLRPWSANLCSTSIAMAFSFYINKRLVFRDNRTMHRNQFIVFIIVTALGLWVLQTGLVVMLAEPMRQFIRDMLGSGHVASRALAYNISKAIATIATAIWNYFWYDRVVFAGRVPKSVSDWL